MGLELKQHRHHQEDMEEVLFGDSELVHYVRHALLSAQEGDIDNYNQLLGVLHHSGRLSPDEVALLVTSLQALSGAASYIDIAYHEALLNSIFGMNMWNYGPDVMEALVELITALAAANGKYIDSCLDMLVSNFMPPFYMLDLLKVPHGLAKKEQVLSRIHKALEDITNLVPLAGMRLSSVVVHRLPKTFGNNAEKDRMTIRTEMFVENMLRLESGSIKQFVGSRMLMAVVDTLVELDVAIGWDDILRDDSSRGVFAIELEDENGGDDDDEDDDAEFPKALTHKYLEKSVIADLLDSLMVRTFEHLESCANNNRLNEVFEILVDSFMLTILNTYKSKFAQFVMFYACALDPENCGTKFANTLLDRFLHGENPLTRMSAVAYLASYLARGKFISVASVANILKRLVDWCSEYCRCQYGGINAQAHRVFYSGFQAIMYVLCFRMGSMMDVPGLKSQILLPIQPILKHNLEPLKVCLPSIVKEFLKQAKAANLFTISKKFVFSNILESDLSREFGGMERMDTFFPFDPCLLRKSDSGYIRPNFVYWKYVRTTYYSANEEYSSDEEIAEDFGDNDMEEEIQLNFSRQDDDDLDEEFGNAMNKMSITPRDGLLKKHGKDRMQMPSRIRPSTSPQFL